VGVAASSVTVGGVGGGSILKGMTWCEKGQQYKWCFLLTYSSPCGTNHSAWKMRRQSYNSEGISETTTLWLRDGYGVVSCTGTNTRTVLIISLNPEYTILKQIFTIVEIFTTMEIVLPWWKLTFITMEVDSKCSISHILLPFYYHFNIVQGNKNTQGSTV